MCTLFPFTYFFLLLFIPLLPFVHKQPTLFFCHHSAFLSLSYMPTILPSLSFVCLSSSPQLLSLPGLIPRKAIMQYELRCSYILIYRYSNESIFMRLGGKNLKKRVVRIGPAENEVSWFRTWYRFSVLLLSLVDQSHLKKVLPQLRNE